MAKYKHFFGVQNLRPNLKSLIVLHDESPKPTPGRRLLAKDFHISRTYEVWRCCYELHFQHTAAGRQLDRRPLRWACGWLAWLETGVLWARARKLGHWSAWLGGKSGVPLLPGAVNLRRRAPLSDVEIAAKRARWERSNLRRKKLTSSSEDDS